MSGPVTERKTIHQLRQARGWSQLEVAVRVGVEQSTISDWERGQTIPRPRHLMSLAELFGVSIETIALGPAEQAP